MLITSSLLLIFVIIHTEYLVITFDRAENRLCGRQETIV